MKYDVVLTMMIVSHDCIWLLLMDVDQVQIKDLVLLDGFLSCGFSLAYNKGHLNPK